MLMLLRDKIAAELDNGVPAHALVPLSRRLMEIDEEVRACDERVSRKGGRTADEGWDDTAV